MKRLGIAAIAVLWMAGAQVRPEPAIARGAVRSPTGTEARFVTHHRLHIRGADVRYTAIAEPSIVHSRDGTAAASLFSFSYIKDGDATHRPVTFVFNGGPGSSSLWLHMGVLGPRRVILDHDPNASPSPPYRTVANDLSPLDATDLVFIDPVGTGFSHTLGTTRPDAFYGVDEDAESVSEFIESWLTAHHRWGSRKFLIGESYGTARAAVLARTLMGGPTNTGLMRGIAIDGIVLLGTLLEARDGDGEPFAFEVATGLPNLADAAAFHGKVDVGGRSVAQFDSDVRRFAMDVYYPALRAAAAGSLPDGQLRSVAAQTSRYIGIPADRLVSTKLVIDSGVFAHSVLAGQGLQLGLYDSRYTLPLMSGGDPVADDPAMARYVPSFVAAFHEMLESDLDVTISEPYRAIVWRGLLDHWKWTRQGVSKGQDYAIDLAIAMRDNPAMRVMVASGYYDLATHPIAAEQLLKRAGAPAERIRFVNYPSGHMLYVGDTAASFAADLRDFIEHPQHDRSVVTDRLPSNTLPPVDHEPRRARHLR